MSEDEIPITILSAISGGVGLVRWYFHLVVLAPRCRGSGTVPLLMILPVISLILVFVVLKKLASWDVRDSPTYITMYMVVGAGWMGLWIMLLPFLGILSRDDALERNNTGAGFTCGGALVGFTACFAGGNIGDGPGWWVVIFAAVLSSGALWLLWMLLDRAVSVVDRISIERDRSSGLRAGAFLGFGGLILGRAVAGDWVSAGATFKDFVMAGWPVIFLWLCAMGFEKFSKPAYRAGHGGFFTEAILPACLMGIIAGGSIVLAGAIP